MCIRDRIQTSQKKGKQLFNLKLGDQLLNITNKNETHIACVAKNSKLLIFETKDLPILKRGGGVQLQKIKKEEFLSDIQTFDLSEGITWKIGSQLRNETDIDFWILSRSDGLLQNRIAKPRFVRWHNCFKWSYR